MLSGAAIVRRGIVRNLLSIKHQQQPCGVDLTLRRVLAWTSAATIDFDNSRRQAANTSELRFSGKPEAVTLATGAYLVEFNETVKIPLDCMAEVYVRSSLWRSGTHLTAGAIDAGYEGALGALLDVRNPHGAILCKNAKLGQIALHQLEGKVAGYSGIYQYSENTNGKDGQAKMKTLHLVKVQTTQGHLTYLDEVLDLAYSSLEC